MKDSFGGSIMIYIIIFFLGIYIVFIALTLRYAQSFRVKNKIIDLIEEHDGFTTEANDSIEDYLISTNIKPTAIGINIVNNGDLKNTCYYVVTSFIDWEWPFLGISGQWDIHGETKNVNTCNYPNGKVSLEFDF